MSCVMVPILVDTNPYSWEKRKYGEVSGSGHAAYTLSIEIRHFHVVVVQKRAKKCIKKRGARAKLLFCSWNLLFFDVLGTVRVVGS